MTRILNTYYIHQFVGMKTSFFSMKNIRFRIPLIRVNVLLFYRCTFSCRWAQVLFLFCRFFESILFFYTITHTHTLAYMCITRRAYGFACEPKFTNIYIFFFIVLYILDNMYLCIYRTGQSVSFFESIFLHFYCSRFT